MSTVLDPQYLIFEIPIFLSALFYLLQPVLGFDPDHDFDVDHDVDLDVGDAGEVESPEDSGSTNLLGLGRVPLSYALTTFAFVWGVVGLIVLYLINQSISLGVLSVLIAVIVATVAAVMVTRTVGSFLGKHIPRVESYGQSPESFSGIEGTVRFAITESSGSMQIYDQRGSFHEVEVRVPIGHPPIPRGQTAILGRYDRNRKVFEVLAPEDFLPRTTVSIEENNR